MEIITGWKGIVNFLNQIGVDFQLRTIKSWHYERLKMPLRKSHHNMQGRVMIRKEDLLKWLDAVTVPKHARSTHD